ncbi:MAG: helix-turn-helix domain-containing protein [Gammaproteobacteria bacterium]|nr:helix-turn-helix domain-containing protein [Gammaproteobacteria bacterium]
MDTSSPPVELEQEFFTQKQLCNLFGVSRVTIYDWMDRRGFPRPKVFSRMCRRWPVSDVRAWIDAQPNE